MKNIIVCIICMAVVVCGCGKKAQERRAEKALEKALEKQYDSEADVKIDDQNMTITTAEGNLAVNSGKGAKVPKDFPSDVYVPKGVSVKMAMELPHGFNILFYTEGDVHEMVEVYKKKMADSGWTQGTVMDMGEQVMMMHTKDERKRTASIAVTTENGKTLIQLATGTR